MWQGISLEGLDDGGDGSFATNRKVLIDSVLAHSHARFDALQQHPVFRASKALEHRTWPIHDEAALATFGDGDIELLIDHFRELKCMVGFNRDEAMRQWQLLKFELRQHGFFNRCSYVQFWEHVAAHFDNGNGYSEFIKIALIVLLIMVDTSCCERAYSLMNRIHTYLCNSLKVKTLNDLRCICSLGPEIKEFDPKPVLKAWLQNQKRSLSVIKRQISGAADGADDQGT